MPPVVLEKDVPTKGKGEKRKAVSMGDGSTGGSGKLENAGLPMKQVKQEKVDAENVEKQTDPYREILDKEAKESLERNADHDNSLFSNTCQQLRDLMKDIFEMKTGKSDDKTLLNEKKIQISLLFVSLKKLNRLEKLRMKSSRDNTNAAKQNLDAFNLQLQNLRYEVLHLKKEVSRCINFRSADQSVNLVSVDEFYREAPPEISCPETSKENPHMERLARLAWELETRKSLDSEVQNLEEEKNKMEEIINQKDDKIKELGPHIKKIIATARPVQNYLDLPMDYEKDQKELARMLPTPLYVLYTQAVACNDTCNLGVKIEIEGNEETAKMIKENGVDALSDEEEEKEAETEHKKKYRTKSANKTVERTNQKIFRDHPLYVVFKIKAADDSEMEIRFKYLLFLEIVTVQTLVHINKRNNSGELLQGSSVLRNLYEGDDGQNSPNMKNEYQLKESGLTGNWSWTNGGQGLPYVWAQRLAGLDFLTGTQSNRSISYLHMENTIKAMKGRFEARLELQKQLNLLEMKKSLHVPQNISANFPSRVKCNLKSWTEIDFEKFSHNDLNRSVINHGAVDTSDYFFRATIQRGSAQLISYVVLKPEYPAKPPIFTLAVYWNGDKTVNNTEWVREFELEMNNGWKDVVEPQDVGEGLLSFQLHRLMVLFDVCLAAVSAASDGDREFVHTDTDRPLFLQPVAGRLRTPPLVYDKEQQLFRHRP